jgi:TolB-like protein/Flp pilus assembly protein TadD
LAQWLHQLKRRNVLRAAALYIGAVWALAQGIAQLAPVFGIPDWAVRWFIIAGVIGFPFWIVFAWFYEFTQGGLKRESERDADDRAARLHDRRLDKWIIGVLLVAVVLLVTNQFVLRRDATSLADATASAEQDGTGLKSIAVLPLVNASGDPQQQFFSDGLSENLIDVLSSIEGLRVSGRSSSFLFRNSKDDPRTIGAKLNVSYLLTGSVQRSSDTIRVRAEVVDTHTGASVFSKRFERPGSDLFALQDELSKSIADTLNVALLSPTADVMGHRPPSGNLEAYNAFLRANFLVDLGNERDTRRAIDEYTHATTLDPRYAMAWARLSRYWTTLAALYLTGNDARAAYAKARLAGDKALALAPDMGDAHLARGWLLENETLDWAGAGAEYEAAQQLSPSNLQTKSSLASMKALQGQLTEAVKLSGEAIASDPLQPNWWNWYSAYLSGLGRTDDAEAAIRKSIALRPQGSSTWAAQLAIIEIQRGDAKAALEAANNEPEGVWHDIARAMALQIGKDRQAADAALALLIKDYGDVAPFQVAQVQALRRDDKAVFRWLDKAHEVHDPGIGNLLIDPLLMRYKQDPRMADFCKTVGLPMPTTSEAVGI